MTIIDYDEYTLVKEPLGNQIILFLIKSLNRFLITALISLFFCNPLLKELIGYLSNAL